MIKFIFFLERGIKQTIERMKRMGKKICTLARDVLDVRDVRECVSAMSAMSAIVYDVKRRTAEPSDTNRKLIEIPTVII
jgi:hypothetical protein